MRIVIHLLGRCRHCRCTSTHCRTILLHDAARQSVNEANFKAFSPHYITIPSITL